MRGEHYANANDYAVALRSFPRDWRTFTKLRVTQELLRRAAIVADRHALRAIDAIHLASVLELQDRLHDLLSFSVWDVDLRRAASVEGITLAH
jgi:predicted nucleic acid-binding protein